MSNILESGDFKSSDIVEENENETEMHDGAAFEEFQNLHLPQVEFQTNEEAEPVELKPRLAAALSTLREQVNNRYKERDKKSDGWIGDKSHCKDGKGKSDHCANIPDSGYHVVTALDITHDPDSGCDNNKLAEALRVSKDQRIKYVIWNKRMYSSYVVGGHVKWSWRDYSGSNDHSIHMHVSVVGSKDLYDSTNSWNLDGVAAHA